MKSNKVRKVQENTTVDSNTEPSESGMKLATKTRETKPDFEKYYTEHRQIMEKNGLKTEDMVALRRYIH